MTEEKDYCCKSCGSDDIMWSAYIDENDNVVNIDMYHTEVWCDVCELFTDYTSKEKYNEHRKH